MRWQWLEQGQSTRVCVVFGGWAVGPSPFAGLVAAGGSDVLFVDDYRDLDCALPDLSSYVQVDLLAWSFGVAAYGHWQAGRADPFHRKAALCGSPAPVDRQLGIPPLAYRRTIDGLTEQSYQQFQERVFGCPQPVAAIDVAPRAEELRAVAARGPAPDTAFDRVWIAEQDQIFPARNLQRVWQGRGRNIDAPHAPFDRFSNWDAVWS